jgi:hypothetical protein
MCREYKEMNYGQFKGQWRYFFGPAMLVVLVVCTLQLGPAWSAHLRHGQAGTWTVTRVACGSKGCNDIGNFVSADGSDARPGVGLDGVSSLRVGASLPAIDSGGDDVYPLGGGNAWLRYTIATAVLVVLFTAWVWTVPVRGIRRRHAAHQSPLADAVSSPPTAGKPRHAKKTWT